MYSYNEKSFGLSAWHVTIEQTETGISDDSCCCGYVFNLLQIIYY